MSDSKVRLAAALRVRGFGTLALNAEQGLYDDFESPMAMPKVTLIADLRAEGRNKRFLGSNATDMIDRVERGEFDNTREEEERWAQTDSGQRALRESGAA